MPKILADTALTGRRGVNVIDRIVSEMGFAWHPTAGDLDTGVDGYIAIRDPETKVATNGVIQVQSKSTLGRFTAETTTGFQFLCDEDDLTNWMSGDVPLIFIRVRPPDEAYWIDVREYFKDATRLKTRRIEFNKERDRFTTGARDRMIRLATANRPGLVFARTRQKETLISNMLEVTRHAATVYVATTPLRTRHEANEKLAAACGSNPKPRAWRIGSKQLYSFDDLDGDHWKGVIEEGTVEPHSAALFAQSMDTEYVNIFAELLGRALSEKVAEALAFHGKRDFYYFRPTADLSTRTISYTGIENATSRAVFKGYGKRRDDPEKPSYYRHSAFRAQFRRYEKTWYLEVTPTYHYTVNGLMDDAFYEEKIKKMKRFELNGSVVGQLMMWRHVLAPPPTTPDIFTRPSPPYPHLEFGSWAAVDVGHGVPERDWLETEEEPSVVAEVDDDAAEERAASGG